MQKRYIAAIVAVVVTIVFFVPKVIPKVKKTFKEFVAVHNYLKVCERL